MHTIAMRLLLAAMHTIAMRLLLAAMALTLGLAPVVEGTNCSLTPRAARSNFCNGGGCQCWCSPAEGAFTTWQYAPQKFGSFTGGPDSCCYDPTSDPPCFGARPVLHSEAHLISNVPHSCVIVPTSSPNVIFTRIVWYMYICSSSTPSMWLCGTF